MNETTHNHYVPRFYLKNFIQNGILYKQDILTLEPNIVNKIEEECMELDLYSTNHISENDTNFFLEYICCNDVFLSKFVNIIKVYINGSFSELYIDYLKHKFNTKIDDIFIYFLQSTIDNNDKISRTQENIFTYAYENNFLRALKQIINSRSIKGIKSKYITNVDIYLYNKMHSEIIKKIHQNIHENIKIRQPNIKIDNNAYEKLLKVKSEQDFYIDIIHYLFVQYFRTKKQINIIINILEQFKNALPFDSNSIVYLFVHFYPFLATINAINKRNHLYIIDNKSSIPFITSDNPCINLCFDKNRNAKLNTNELQLFFPISPTLALLYSATENLSASSKGKITYSANEVIDVNNKIKQNSEHFIYSSIPFA
jgi:predicted CopG family antitoxin